MVKHFHNLFPEQEDWRERAENIAARTHEFTHFLVNVLKVEKLQSSFNGRVTWHDACHGLRELGLRAEPRKILNDLDSAKFVEMPNADSCCGFGGTFSVKYPEISVAILDKKIEGIEKTGADVVVSCDASCLMQIGGRLSRLGSKVRTMHIAEILASQDNKQ
jgi:L-lactate dehydrogenase complex protein LldE